MDFIHLWRDNRALSKILHSTIPIPVHGLKVKVTDLEKEWDSFLAVISILGGHPGRVHVLGQQLFAALLIINNDDFSSISYVT